MKHKKILIADEDPSTRELLLRILTRFETISLIDPQNAEDPLRAVDEEEPDLVLIDIQHKRADAYELCRRVKNDSRFRRTAVIFIVSVPNSDIDDQIIQANCDDLVRKPLDANELYLKIRHHLCRDSSPGAEITDKAENIDLGEGYCYRTHAKSLHKSGKQIPLMFQEMLLLETLLRYKNRVVPYDQLLNAISKSGESTMGNLRTLVKLLRAKTHKKLIKTFSSLGYQITL